MTRGRPPYPDVLTPRQWEVLELVREGRSNGEIARELGISRDGAKFHVSEILTKLGVSSRRDAAIWDGEPAGDPQSESATQAAMAALRRTAHAAPQSRKQHRTYARIDGRALDVAGAPEWEERAA
jgi:DNA-binding NarL/FixJ family response regulator